MAMTKISVSDGMKQNSEGGAHHGTTGIDSDYPHCQKRREQEAKKENKIPVVVYGKEFENKLIAVDEKGV